MKKTKPLYFVWCNDGYFEQFESLKDAVTCHNDRKKVVEIFKASPKSLGYYTETKVVKKCKAPAKGKVKVENEEV